MKLSDPITRSEPVPPTYKVDDSFGSSPSFRSKGEKLSSRMSPSSSTISATVASSAGVMVAVSTSPTNSRDELRVPPLHISIKGKNASVVQIGKKEKKKDPSAVAGNQLSGTVVNSGLASASSSSDSESNIKKRVKLKKLKDQIDGNKLLPKKTVNMIIGKD